jgi:hypothetical protein
MVPSLLLIHALCVVLVQDVDQDGMQGTRYSFTFTKNPFFDNQVGWA